MPTTSIINLYDTKNRPNQPLLMKCDIIFGFVREFSERKAFAICSHDNLLLLRVDLSWDTRIKFEALNSFLVALKPDSKLHVIRVDSFNRSVARYLAPRN